MKTNKLVFVSWVILNLTLLDIAGITIVFMMFWFFFVLYVWKRRIPNQIKARFFL